MFISKIYEQELRQLLDDSHNDLLERVENIVWPSEASADLGPFTVGACGRELFYKMVGQRPTEPMSLKGRTICELGNVHESLQVERLRKAGLDPKEQVKFRFKIPSSKKDVTVSGKVDVLIYDGKARRAVEIKSFSNFMATGISGSDTKVPLPLPSHLMQAILYKFWASKTPEGSNEKIEDVYLILTNRNDGSCIYFKIDLDDNNFPIITAFDHYGRQIGKVIRTAEYPSYDDFAKGSHVATSELARVAELRISADAIFEKFEKVCTTKEARVLPPVDFKLIFSEDDLKLLLKCGKISKKKLSMIKSGSSALGDFKCSGCAFKSKCLSDSGINFK
jgi:hypothetical protein